MLKYLKIRQYKQSRHFSLGLRGALILVLGTLLSACKQNILDPQGLIALQEKNILVLSLLLMLIIVLPVIILTLVFAWRYRATNQKAPYSPDWAHSTLLEVICWFCPCLIIIILGAITWTSSHQLDPYQPLSLKDKKTLVIQAIALEWKWLFIYPEQNIATINYLKLPVGVPVRFDITAEGPMNSLQIPQLAGQIYAMAGMKTVLHLQADRPGEYQGFSANFSGDGFSDMKFVVRADSEENFGEWVKMVKHSPEKLTAFTYNRLALPSISKAAEYYSAANKDLFEVVVMKAMMPMNEAPILVQAKQGH